MMTRRWLGTNVVCSVLSLWLPFLLVSSLVPFNHHMVTIVYAQQAPNPGLTIPLLARPEAGVTSANPSGTFRNDFCSLSNQVQVLQNLTLGEALQGVNLHVALMQGDFVKFTTTTTTNDNNGRPVLDPDFPGLVPRLLDDLCDRAGCQWRDTYAAPSYADLGPNRTFLELLLWSTDVYDLMAEWWMRSVERLKAGATFTEPWYDGTIIMVAPKPGTGESDKFDPWGWLAPFDRGVWIMVIATVLASAAIHALLVYCNPHCSGDDANRRLDPIHATWLFATAFAGQFEFDPQTGPARLFTFSIAFWALLMTSAYTANLASFLVIRNTPPLRIESLPQAINLQMRLCVWRSSGTDVAVTNAFPTFAASDRYIRTETTKGVYEGLRNGECDIAVTEVSTWDVFQTNADINGDCTLTWIGRPFQSIPASFAVKGDAGTLCTSLLRDVFNLHLHNMQMDGTIDNLWEEHISHEATVSCNADETDTTADTRRRLAQQHSDMSTTTKRGRRLKSAAQNAGPEGGNSDNEDSDTIKLTLTNMGGVFLLHGTLSAVSVLCALVHWMWNKKDNMPSTTVAVSEQSMTRKLSKLGFDADDEVSTNSLFYFDAEGGPSASRGLDGLRVEMNIKLRSIEEKLAAILEKQ